MSANPPTPSPHVLLITEGTYPFYWGGVSTWCHQLLRDLPAVKFTLMSIVSSPHLEPQFQLPANVADFRVVPMWGMREALEASRQFTLAEILQRKRQTTPLVIRDLLVPAFSSFLEELFEPHGDPTLLGYAIHAMYQFFKSFDFDTAMRSQAVWECFVQSAQQYYPQMAEQHGYPHTALALAELTAAMQIVYHWFFPLAQPLPHAEVAHAAMAGICTMVGMVAKIEYGAGFLLTEHGIYLRESYLAEVASTDPLFLKLIKLRFARRITEAAYAWADQISPCCDYNQRWELRNGARPAQVQTIYYGSDSQAFTPVEKPVDEPPVVVWVGRINPLKDLETLLRAAAIVQAARPDIQFRLFGNASKDDEPYHAKIMALHHELGLEKSVTFCGFIAKPQLAFNQADVVVMSSISEAFPFSILEAMLCGKPVVSTGVGGIPEQLLDTGIVVEPRNPAEMARAILELMNDAERRHAMGKAARERAAREFTLERQGIAHLETYAQLANQTAKSTKPSLFVFTGKQSEQIEIGGDGSAPLVLTSAASVQLAMVRNRQPQVITAKTTDTLQLAPSAEMRVLNVQEFDALVADVQAQMPMPVDALEVTAVLESRGVTDAVAARKYGVADAFQLGEFVLRRLTKPLPSMPKEPPTHRRAPRREALGDYARGFLSIVPGLLLVAIIQMYGTLGLWRVGQMIILSLGVTAAMLIANGFSYAVSRRGSIYLSMNDRAAVSRFLRHSTVSIGAVVIVLAGLVAGITTATGLLASDERWLFAFTFIGISAILLVSSGLALVQANGWLSIALCAGLLAGLLVDWLTRALTDQHLLIASAAGFFAAIGLLLYAARHQFANKHTNGRARRIVLPTAAYLLYEAGPYFAYGSLYMLMILLPHFLGWFGARADNQEQFTAILAIELGLTASLPPTLLLNGISEHTLRRFWREAIRGQQLILANQLKQFGGQLRRVYWQQFKQYLFWLGITSGLTWFIFQTALRDGRIESWLHFPLPPTIDFIFTLGLAVYALLACGLYNAMFCVSLARPDLPLRAVLLSIATILIVGAPLSFGMHFSFALIGFIAGALVFAGISFWSTLRFLNSADYHYYSAF